MLFSIEVVNRKASCCTTPTALRSDCSVDLADVLAVDGDPAAGHVVEARDQVGDGRLAAAGRADDADRLAGAAPRS